MTITISAFENSQTISTTEKSIPGNANYSSGSPQTGTGIFQCFLDLNALAAADIFRFKVYEAVISSGGTQRLIYQAEFANAQGSPIWVSPTLVLGVGWDMTLLKIAGTDRAIPARIAQVA